MSISCSLNTKRLLFLRGPAHTDSVPAVKKVTVG